MNALTDLDRDKLERIANMMVHGVPAVQIAEAVNLSEGRISQLKTEDHFKQMLAEANDDFLQAQLDINDSWNKMEMKALGIVNSYLEWSKDPDFAMRAATMANRAERRGKNTNVPLSASNGKRVGITISSRLATRLGGPEDAKVINGNGEIAEIDTLAPSKVEELLGISVQVDVNGKDNVSVGDIFDNDFLAVIDG